MYRLWMVHSGIECSTYGLYIQHALDSIYERGLYIQRSNVRVVNCTFKSFNISYCRFPPVTLSSRHVFVECSLRKVVVD